MVANELFREDLLYRINTIHLKLPPLRERKEDILPLAYRFLSQFAATYSRPALRFSGEAENALLKCEWRGNIRELSHTVEKAVIISDKETIGCDELQITTQNEDKEAENTTIEHMERQMISEALQKYEGNLSLAAEKLGISRQTLYNKMKRFGIG